MPIFDDNLLIVIETVLFIEISVDQIKPGFERRGAGTLVVYGFQFIAVDFHQCLCNLLLSPEHAGRMGLHHAHAVIPVNDKSRKIVSFAVDKAITVGGFTVSQTGRNTDSQRSGKH